MSASLPQIWGMLASVVPEERRGRPGAAREAALAAANGPDADAQLRPACILLAVYSSFVSGEPREALRLLDQLTATDEAIARRIEAARVWARSLERNWYPGDIGAERPPTHDAFVFESSRLRPGDPETVLLELSAALGPATVPTSRSVVDSMRIQNPPAVDNVAGGAIQSLAQFCQESANLGATTAALWARSAVADLARRTGRLPEARAELAVVRAAHESLQDPLGVAITWMLEGDWLATPGASPDSLGIRLEDESPASFAEQRDDTAAAAAYAQALARLTGVDAPRARGALALRFALLASRGGDTHTQAELLATARAEFAEAGDAAGAHLASVHGWVASIEHGDLAPIRAHAPLEWGPLHGPVLEIADWATARGSPAYAAGLGRLLHRCGQRWVARREFDRAEIAFRLARGLITLNDAVPGWTIPEALAQLDEKRGFTARGLVRRLLILDQLPAPCAPSVDGLAWLRDVYLTSSMINIPTGVSGAGQIAIQLIERGERRMRDLLAVANLPVAPTNLDIDAALRALQDVQRSDSVAWQRELASGQTTGFERQMLELGAAATQQTLERAQPLAALVRGRMNDRMGFEAEADAWFDAAVRHAREGSEEVRWMQVLALNAWGRRDEALAAFGKVAGDGALKPETLAALALRAGDFAYARRAFAALPVPADAPRGGAWRDLADRAEAEADGGDPQAALDFGTRALSDLEGMIESLGRPAERLEMCDDISVAALYQYAARAQLALAGASDLRGDAAAAAEHRREAFLIVDRHRSMTLPEESSLVRAGARDESTRRWQQATTEHVTAYQRLLAELMARGAGTPRAIEAMAAAERALVAIEAQLDSGSASQLPGGRAQEQLRMVDLQARLPVDAVLLEYQLVGRDLVRFAVTAARIEAAFTHLPRGLEGKVSRLLRACAGGAAATQEESDLATILLEPFAALLAPAKRVIVVPSGGLTALPFHLLPLCGEPLGAGRVVSYLPAAALLLRDDLDRPLARGTALVIGDPEFDTALHPGLARLAGAAIEARRIGELYGTDAVFEAAAARESDLRPKLAGRALLHFAAHGRLDEVAPYTSSIVLAGRDELTVSDFIGLQIDADLAVLSACDTGRGTTTLGGDVIGLTRGLLAAGVRRCVVSLWPVDDVAACVTMVAFHSFLKKGGLSPAAALAQAQEQVRELGAAEIADRYRAMGGVLGAGQRSTRRGSALRAAQLPEFPEADADEPVVVESAAGNSARIWAPFILVGC